MQKHDIDTKYLMYDPFDEKTISKLESYDEFNVNFGLPKKEIISYIILVYDLNTQLRKEIPYFNQRKIIAAELSGFEQNKDKTFTKPYEDILLGKNTNVNQAISKYIRLFANPKYIALIYYWSILSAEFTNITSTAESKDYKATIANIEKLESKINECTEALFGGNEISDIKRELYMSVEKENLRIRPEDIANAEDVDELIESPYGSDYKQDKLKYLGNR